jgi:tetratricopeptide (TPR) repeat protein
MTVVTRRGPLRGLQALDDATALQVQPLDADESVSLVRTLLDTARDTAGVVDGVDNEQLRETAELCARLPLALRIAAANLAGRTRTQAADLLAAMRVDLLGQLAIDDEPPAVRAAFDTSYATLPRAAQDVFRLIGRAPGQDISVPAVAALLGERTTTMASELARLVRAGLADHLPGDRFGLHDLLRRYAAELPGPHDDDAAMHRLFSFYHHTAIAAVATAVQGVTRLDHDPCDPDVRPLSFGSAASASAWLTAELANLVALCAAAADSASARVVWQLADALRDYFWIHRCVPEWLAIAGNALYASKAAGDPRAQAASHNSLGVANWCLSHYSEAAAHFQDAIEVGSRVLDDRATAAALSNLGGVYRETGDLEASISCCDRAVVLYEDLANTVGAANSRITLSGVLLDTGRLAEAVAQAEQALAYYREIDRKDGQGSALLLISEAHTRTGHTASAIETAQEAMALFHAVGARQGEACALLSEADAHLAANRVDTAEPLAHTALAISMDTGSEQLEVEAANCLADITLHRGELRAAVDAYASTANIARRIKLRKIELAALIGQAQALYDLGDFQAARHRAAAAAQLAKDKGYKYHAATARDILSKARLSCGDDAD